MQDGPGADAIRCLMTSTEGSRRFVNASGLSALDILRGSLNGAQAGCRPVARVDRPEDADVILFAESHQNTGAVRTILRHPLYAAFPHKTVVHSGMDDPDPALPGLFPSIDRRWARGLCCEGSPFLVALNPFVRAADPPGGGEPPLLASFMGSCPGKRVRERLRDAAHRHGWADIRVVDSGPEFVRSAQEGDAQTHEDLKRAFADGLAQSRFVLCPAGTGPSSFRIYEAMKAGRAPVVIADGWSPPPGPDWARFLLRVPERDVARLPHILQREAGSWRRRGALARAAWEAYFDPATFGPRIVERALAVLARAEAAAVRRRAAAWVYGSGVRPARHLRHRLARKARTLRR